MRCNHAVGTGCGLCDTGGVGSSELPAGTVTFLFTDIEGHTRLWREHPQSMSAALARHDAILRDTIERHGGVVFSTAGDSFSAAFGIAGDAVGAAVEAQDSLEIDDTDRQAILYAVKATPNPHVLKVLARAGLGFDVASPQEIDWVLAAGAIRPAEAFEYVCKQDKIESILFGASTKEHIKHSRDLIQSY